MITKLLFGMLLYLFIGISFAVPALQSDIPLYVSYVKVKNIKGDLVRIIKYFPNEKTSYIDIEIIKAPELEQLIDRLSIANVKIDYLGKETVLDFKNSQMTSIEDVQFDEGSVNFKIFYVFTGTAAPSVLVECKVDVINKKIREPVCHEVPMKD